MEKLSSRSKADMSWDSTCPQKRDEQILATCKQEDQLASHVFPSKISGTIWTRSNFWALSGLDIVGSYTSTNLLRVWNEVHDPPRVFFSRRYENIDFQNLVVPYWPSSWLRPFSLCGDVIWSWISNASRTFRSNLRSLTFKVFFYIFSIESPRDWSWLEIPVKSHISSFHCSSWSHSLQMRSLGFSYIFVPVWRICSRGFR